MWFGVVWVVLWWRCCCCRRVRGGGGGSGVVDVSGQGVEGASGGGVESGGVVSVDVLAGDLAARGWNSGGGLRLVWVSLDSLSVGWEEGLGGGSSGLRLRWRAGPVDGQGWPGVPAVGEGYVDLGGSETGFVVSGLDAGTPYGLRLETADGVEAAVGAFETLWSPVVGVRVEVLAHDAVRVSWDGAKGWAPMGYALRWRARGSERF